MSSLLEYHCTPRSCDGSTDDRIAHSSLRVRLSLPKKAPTAAAVQPPPKRTRSDIIKYNGVTLKAYCSSVPTRNDLGSEKELVAIPRLRDRVLTARSVGTSNAKITSEQDLG